MCKKLSTKHVVVMGMLIALNIVFVRYLSIDTGIIRISFGFIPNAVAGMVLGPVWGGVTALLGDFLGMLINSKGGTYFLPLGISEFINGFIYGLLLYRGNKGILKVSVGVVIQFILINLFLNSAWLMILMGKGYWAIFSSRLVAATVNLPLHVVGVGLICRYLKPYVRGIKA